MEYKIDGYDICIDALNGVDIVVDATKCDPYYIAIAALNARESGAKIVIRKANKMDWYYKQVAINNGKDNITLSYE